MITASALTNGENVITSMVTVLMILMKENAFVKLAISAVLIKNVLNTLNFVMERRIVQMAKTSTIVVSAISALLLP